MNGLVTVTTNHQGFPVACRHPFSPERFFFAPESVQISQLADVVNLAVLLRSTQLTFLGEKALYKFRSTTEDRLWLVIEYGLLLAP